jgi:hypothetical protein
MVDNVAQQNVQQGHMIMPVSRFFGSEVCHICKSNTYLKALLLWHSSRKSSYVLTMPLSLTSQKEFSMFLTSNFDMISVLTAIAFSTGGKPVDLSPLLRGFSGNYLTSLSLSLCENMRRIQSLN